MRRPARRIYIVNVQRYETDSTEDWTADYRFSSERAANAFSKLAQGRFDYVGQPYPSPLWHSGRAAFEELVEQGDDYDG